MTNTKQTAVIVIATYNESESVTEMMDVLFNKIIPTINNWNVKVLIIDDTSPDKTYEMEKLHADVLIEFDCDFQHPPSDIPKLLEQIDNGYDFVIGSRKIKGGSVPQSWGLKRKFFTFVGGFTSRFILFFPFKPFFQVTDPTTGLRASRVKNFVDHINLDKIYSLKFGYKIELLFRMIQLKAKFKEIPLEFGLREKGESKIAKDTAKDILFVSIKCRWYDEFTQKFLKFGIVGGFGFVVNTLGAKIFKSMMLTPESNISLLNGIANAMAAELAIISNFIWNNVWTFADQKITSINQLLSKFLTFNLSSVVTGIIIPSIVISLMTLAFGDHLFIFQIIAIFGLTIPLNWFVYNKFIWKKK